MDWPAAKGRKPRGSLLFANGRGDFIEKYLEAFAHWHAGGWAITSFDWRGQGGSQGEGAEAAAASFDPMIDDLAALIEDWRAGPGPHVALAHSMGGHLLLRTLVERQPPLDAAVLIAPMMTVNSAPIPGGLAPDIADTIYRLGLGGVPIWPSSPGFNALGGRRQRNLTASPERYEDELWWWAREPTFDLGLPNWSWIRAAFRSGAAAFTPEKLARVDLPILIIGAEHDRLVSAPAIRRVAAQLPRAELEMMDDAAHEILRDADPVRLRALARIDAFLAGHAA
ncbi:MAG TPA: alpha/beta hydrolase [Allosphingosinicella sp.]|nr:alpha/beta hydrolase [Allosphingosinicella sp.]